MTDTSWIILILSIFTVLLFVAVLWQWRNYDRRLGQIQDQAVRFAESYQPTVHRAVQERDLVIEAARPLIYGRSIYSFTGSAPTRADEMAWNNSIDHLTKVISRITGRNELMGGLQPAQVLAALNPFGPDPDRPYAEPAFSDEPRG